MIDYRRLRPGNLTSPRFSHLLWLLYWPAYGLAFLGVEKWTDRGFHILHCALDDRIPFCEYFIYPYYFWFAFLVGIHIYTLLFDIPLFKKLMRFIIITYSVTILIYLLFPNAQHLRPDQFPRQNLSSEIVRVMYGMDTDTNVCPSLHIVGSLAVLFTAWHSRHFSSPGWRAAFCAVTLLICASTVFLKQHSLIDVACGAALSAAAVPFAFLLPGKREGKEAEKKEAERVSV